MFPRSRSWPEQQQYQHYQNAEYPAHDGCDFLPLQMPRAGGSQTLPFRTPQMTSYSTSNAARYVPAHFTHNSRHSMTGCDQMATFNHQNHMLRRKTPNGTLAAAYDGSPTEWSQRPPAAKLLKSLPDSQFSSTDPNHSAPRNWFQLPPLLYSTPSRSPQMQVPTALQPNFQSSSGPTASNPNQRYGPYWPDGSFDPYRPASIRNSGQFGNDYRESSFSLPSMNSGLALNGFNNLALDNDMSPNNSPAINGFIHPITSPPVMQSLDYGNMGFSQATNLRAQPATLNSQLQFKDKALRWAQSVFVNLLAYLHTSKPDQQSEDKKVDLSSRSSQQASVYQKPPTDLSVKFAALAGLVSNHQRENQTPMGLHETQDLRRNMDDVQSNYRIDSGHQSLTGNLPANVPQTYLPGHSFSVSQSNSSLGIMENAKSALELLSNLSRESQPAWIDGMLLAGCLAYSLKDYATALHWYSQIIAIDASHVEAMSNLAATLLSLNRREEAEQYWLRAVKLRPSYFEAVEHLIGLLCGDHRGAEAVGIIEYLERCLKFPPSEAYSVNMRHGNQPSYVSVSNLAVERSNFGYDANSRRNTTTQHNDTRQGFGSSGYAIPGSDNGRMLALLHAKGNLLYAQGDIDGASCAFEDAVLISTSERASGIAGLIQRIHDVILADNSRGTDRMITNNVQGSDSAPLLLTPDKALRTASLVFLPHGELPGLKHVPEGIAKRAALFTTSNSLLSLAKIFQDGLSTGPISSLAHKSTGIGEILSLYYLSLSLQPSASTANNVGILLASVQQPANAMINHSRHDPQLPPIPGVIPGSGIALALAFYNYGLNLDPRHAHLFTNLGSLLKDIGQLAAAIKMYEQAVACDGRFDIALANLANAVKDQGRISDAIEYYRRAVAASPDFAEAVCGLSNALNSVCDWTRRGGVIMASGKYDRWHVDENGMLCDAKGHTSGSGWMKRVVGIVGKQLKDGAGWGHGIIQDQYLNSLLPQLELLDAGSRWPKDKADSLAFRVRSWAGRGWEGSRIVRLVERAIRRGTHRWYIDKYTHGKNLPESNYRRPLLPAGLSIPGAPTVLPFHTFTCPLTAKDIRMISQRNALRISTSTLRASWLPRSVFPPPPPPNTALNIGYVSSDFNNHPLAHLMQSVFGFHDIKRAKAICYATTPSDQSIHRQQIEKEAPVFRDASSWSSEKLVQQIIEDEIHILVNLNGYTRGARNEVFAARPAPIQMSFMGFAGTLGAEWCDYLLADKLAIPPGTLRPWRRNIDIEDQICSEDSAEEEDWVYSENIIFCRDTFFCCDHRQSSVDPQIPWDEEQQRRWNMRKEIFPNLSDDAIILGNFNQLYKIEPTTFRTWLRILAKVPNAILWLLRFPDLGESNLKRTAKLWAGDEVASRLWFTDVAPKGQHIARARVCDLFLDTPECNAHTTAADVLWSSTPLLTLPKYDYKMCSRMAASILTGALPKSSAGKEAAMDLLAKDEDQYEEFAIKLATGLSYNERGEGTGRLLEIRKVLYESRWNSALFDTTRWVRDLEEAYHEAWKRWVEGIGGDIYL